MKNKAILISILLNTCIATNVYAKEIDNSNYFYFGSKFNTLQPNKITKSDLSNFKDLYDNYWSHSLYGFLMGYQHNAYFGLEISYNNLFTNQSNYHNIIKKDKRNQILRARYLENIHQDMERERLEEEQKLNEGEDTSYDNTSYSNFHDSSLFSIRNDDHYLTKKLLQESAHFKNLRSIHKNTKISENKKNKINIIYPQKNLEITTRFSYPIFSSIDLYSRVGCAMNLNQNMFKIKNFNTHYPIKNNVFPLISFGIQYKINQNFYSRIEFEKRISYFSDTKHDNLNSINFHFIWNFQNIFSVNEYNNGHSSIIYDNELKNLSFKKDL